MQLISAGPYQGMAQSTIRFCEPPLPWLISQPLNTWSNLAYIFVGAYLLYRASKTKSVFLKLFAVFTIFIGGGSFYHHMSSTFIGGSLDWASMVLLSTLLLTFCLYRLELVKDKYVVPVFLLIAAVIYGIHFPLDINFGIDFGTQLFAVEAVVVGLIELFLARKHRYDLKNVNISIFLLLTAMAFWLLDYFHIWCDPATMHIISGHALWHVLTAVAIYFLYLHFEKVITKSNK